MATTNNKEKAKKHDPLKSQDRAVSVPLNTIITGDIFNRMTTLKKEKGFLNHQEIVRLAIAYYLEKTGY